MDRDTLVAAVRTRCGIPSDDGLFPDATMVLLVNQAVKKVGTEYEWPWLETKETLTVPTSVTGTIYAAVNSNPDTITRSGGSFVTDGFVAGQRIVVSGFATAANNGTFTIATVAALTLTLTAAAALTAEAAGPSVTIRGTGELDLASGYVSTITVFPPDTPPLKRIDSDEADWWGTTNTGTVKAFALDGRTIRFVPRPTTTTTFTHRYVATEIDLSGGTSTPLAPEPWMNCIIEYAAYLAFRRSQNQPEAGAAKAAYDAEIEVMKQRTPERASSKGGGQDRPMPKPDKAAP